jgi:hypothetical protein
VRPRDRNGNIAVGPVSLQDSTDSIVWSEGLPVVVSGVQDLIVVQANGRVLVIARSQAADLKRLLDSLPHDIRELKD